MSHHYQVIYPFVLAQWFLHEFLRVTSQEREQGRETLSVCVTEETARYFLVVKIRGDENICLPAFQSTLTRA